MKTIALLYLFGATLFVAGLLGLVAFVDIFMAITLFDSPGWVCVGSWGYLVIAGFLALRWFVKGGADKLGNKIADDLLRTIDHND